MGEQAKEQVVARRTVCGASGGLVLALARASFSVLRGAVVWTVLASCPCETVSQAELVVPTLFDTRLQINLFADSSQIVTPIGLAIDAHDRLFVVESHTHHPPASYNGPEGDRIKCFVDRDDDGRPDEVTIFASELHQCMNLAFSPEGDLYAVCSREVVCLPDADGDGRADETRVVATLETDERYAHNSLLGITFHRDGTMYIARGNTGSRAYRLVGSDGSFVGGYGDGGSVVRCRADGREMEEVATGFWNPFDLKFDRFGRLLLVDNDPDARGPNRLLHVVFGGDYGYKSLYGGSGTHAFQGWDGTLPGTLPFIAGTGEAPSGLIDCRRAKMPASYDGSVLATIWNENSVERFQLTTAGRTVVVVEKSVFLRGTKQFRPVAVDCDTRGKPVFDRLGSGRLPQPWTRSYLAYSNPGRSASNRSAWLFRTLRTYRVGSDGDGRTDTRGCSDVVLESRPFPAPSASPCAGGP